MEKGDGYEQAARKHYGPEFKDKMAEAALQ
jgi:hypothetical protein